MIDVNPNDVIYGVISDNSGGLWLSTNKGLCSFGKSGKTLKNYTDVNGLMSNEFNLGAFMKTKKGELYFGGIYGFNYFNPAELKNTQKDIGVIFTKFKLEKEWVKYGEAGSPQSSEMAKIRVRAQREQPTLCLQIWKGLSSTSCWTRKFLQMQEKKVSEVPPPSHT